MGEKGDNSKCILCRQDLFGMVNFQIVNDSYGEERVLSIQIVYGCSVQYVHMDTLT